LFFPEGGILRCRHLGLGDRQPIGFSRVMIVLIENNDKLPGKMSNHES